MDMIRHDAFIPEHDRASVSEALEAALYCAAFQRMEEMEMKRTFLCGHMNTAFLCLLNRKESVAENSEKFEDWRGDVSAQLGALRSQFNAFSARQKGEKGVSRALRRLFDASTSMRTKAGKRIDELEETWKDVSKKL